MLSKVKKYNFKPAFWRLSRHGRDLHKRKAQQFLSYTGTVYVDTTELVDLAVIFPDLEIELNTPALITSQVKLFTSKRVVCSQGCDYRAGEKYQYRPALRLQLVIYDAYRPQQAQAMLWQAAQTRNMLLM